jgi:hypothetical protein
MLLAATRREVFYEALDQCASKNGLAMKLTQGLQSPDSEKVQSGASLFPGKCSVNGKTAAFRGC